MLKTTEVYNKNLSRHRICLRCSANNTNYFIISFFSLFLFVFMYFVFDGICTRVYVLMSSASSLYNLFIVLFCHSLYIGVDFFLYILLLAFAAHKKTRVHFSLFITKSWKQYSVGALCEYFFVECQCANKSNWLWNVCTDELSAIRIETKFHEILLC